MAELSQGQRNLSLIFAGQIRKDCVFAPHFFLQSVVMPIVVRRDMGRVCPVVKIENLAAKLCLVEQDTTVNRQVARWTDLFVVDYLNCASQITVNLRPLQQCVAKDGFIPSIIRLSAIQFIIA